MANSTSRKSAAESPRRSMVSWQAPGFGKQKITPESDNLIGYLSSMPAR